MWYILDKGIFIVREFFNKHKHDLIAFLLYLPVTILLTYPVAFRIGSAIPGLGADSFQWMRILWYTKIPFLFEPELTTLTHDTLMFYPDGIASMPFPSAFNQATYLLLSPYLELPVIYTILWLLSFFLGSFGCYLLVKYLTGNSYAAFLSGIIFAFSPYHFSRGLYFFGATTIQWFPFCALYLMKMFREGGTNNSIAAGVFFILISMSCPQHMVFMGVFATLLFIYEHYLITSTCISGNNDSSNILEQLRESLKKYGIFGIVAFSGIIPLMIHDIRVALSGENFLRPGAGELTTLSNDLISYFIPSHLHPIFGGYVSDIYINFPSWLPEKVNYIGYTVLFLSIYVFFTLKNNNEVKFWLIAAAFFTLISLGPLLRINGETVFTIFDATLPLPYILLYHIIPFLDNCRTVGRLFVLATLAFSVLAGYGIASLLKTQDKRKIAAVILISSLMIFSYLSIPYPTTHISKPEFYSDIALDNEHYALLEIPATNNAGNLGFEKLYYQTIHGKAIVSGYAARYPSNAHHFQKYTPFVRELTYLTPSVDILTQDIAHIGTSVLNYYNIKYIVIHPTQLSQENIAHVTQLLESTINTEPIIYENDSIIIYSVPNEPIQPFMTLGNGWHNVEMWSGIPTRWMSNNATIVVYSNEDYIAELSLYTRSFNCPRTLEIYSSDEMVYCTKMSTNFSDVAVPLLLHKGENVIRFYVPEGAERPCDISKSNNKDSRQLSLAVQNIILREPEKHLPSGIP